VSGNKWSLGKRVSKGAYVEKQGLYYYIFVSLLVEADKEFSRILPHSVNLPFLHFSLIPP
jgi:hypothetical protein